MERKRLFWQLYPSYLWIVFLSVFIILLFALISFRSLFFEQTINDLDARANLLAGEALDYIQSNEIVEMDNKFKRLGKATGTRITVIARDGAVLADSDFEATRIENHANRPEVHEAFEHGKRGVSRRYSTTYERNMIYVAIPLLEAKQVQGVLRMGVPISFVQHAFWPIYVEVGLGSMVLVILVAIVSWLYSGKIARPLEEMRAQAEQIAKGELSGVSPTLDSVAWEIESLGQAINDLSFQLNSRMKTILAQKNEEEAILESMTEGVVAIDNHHKILNINEAASHMFGVERKEVLNKSVEAVIRIPKLQKFIQRVLDGEQNVEEEVVLGESERYWQVHGNPLRGGDGKEIGALFVFTDISRMRELEGHRRDFVANVSHELRTPLTSIKGFLETLKDGAIHNIEDASRFLDIALKHTDRLNAIIEDLLRLSRMEKETDSSEIVLNHGLVRKVLDEAIQLCEVKSKQKDVQLKLECPAGLSALINPPLLEQAVVNLIDNAVKFSEEGGSIFVRAKQNGEEVVISVVDQGAGISQEHLPRIFERFYRVDKARSRNMGGTGLGLAIVKHVALAHRGFADVKSELGKGSEFSIRLRAFA